MENRVRCKQCGNVVHTYRNPIPTVDIIISIGGQVVLIRRRNPPYGWAIPGGFIDYGESAEHAAIREAREETSLDVEDLRQFRVYSQPNRDPRHHTLSVVFIARAQGTPKAADDASEIGLFGQADRPANLAFDHDRILTDYFSSLTERESP